MLSAFYALALITLLCRSVMYVFFFVIDFPDYLETYWLYNVAGLFSTTATFTKIALGFFQLVTIIEIQLKLSYLVKAN